MANRYNPFEKEQEAKAGGQTAGAQPTADMRASYENRHKELYEGAKKIFGNDFMSYDDFRWNMDNEDSRRNFYDNIQKRKPMKKVKSYDDFNALLGYDANYKEQAQDVAGYTAQQGEAALQQQAEEAAAKRQQAQTQQSVEQPQTPQAANQQAAEQQTPTPPTETAQADQQPQQQQGYWLDNVLANSNARAKSAEDYMQSADRRGRMQQPTAAPTDTTSFESVIGEVVSEAESRNADYTQRVDTFNQRVDTLNRMSEELNAKYPKGWVPKSKAEEEQYKKEVAAYNKEVNAVNRESEALNETGAELGKGIGSDARLQAVNPNSARYAANGGWTYAQELELNQMEEAARAEREANIKAGKPAEGAATEKYRKRICEVTGIADPDEAEQAWKDYGSMQTAKKMEGPARNMVEAYRKMAEQAPSDIKPENYHTRVLPTGMTIGYYDGQMGDKSHYQIAQQLSEKALRQIENYKTYDSQRGQGAVGNFGSGLANTARGFGQAITDLSTWDFGLSELNENIALANAAKKFNSGAELTDGERAVLDAAAMQMAVQASLSTGFGFQAGEVTANAIPFMIQMCIAPEAQIGNSVGANVAKYAIKKLAGKAGAKIASRLIGGAAQIGANTVRGNIMALNPMQLATTASGVIGRQVENVQGELDEGGEFHANMVQMSDKDFYNHLWKGIYGQGVENSSEFTGDTILEPLANMMAWGVRGSRAGKMMGNLMGKLSTSKVGQWLGRMQSSTYYKTIQELKKRSHMSGVWGETGEEIWGGAEKALFGVEGRLTSGYNEQGNWEQGVFSWDNYKETFITLLPMQAMFGALGMGGYGVQKADARSKMSDAKGRLGVALLDHAPEAIAKIDKMPEESFGEELGKLIEGGDYNNEQKSALVRYAAAVQYYRGLDAAASQDMAHNLEEKVFGAAYDEGYKTTDQTERENLSTIAAMDNESMEATFDTMEEEGNGNVDYYRQLIDQGRYGDVLAQMQEDGCSEGERRIVEHYITSSQKRNGALAALTHETVERLSAEAARIEGITDMASGNVREVQTPTGEHGYITNSANGNAWVKKDDDTSEMLAESALTILSDRPSQDVYNEASDALWSQHDEAVKNLWGTADDLKMNDTLDFGDGREARVIAVDAASGMATIAAANGEQKQVPIDYRQQQMDAERFARPGVQEVYQKRLAESEELKTYFRDANDRPQNTDGRESYYVRGQQQPSTAATETPSPSPEPSPEGSPTGGENAPQPQQPQGKQELSPDIQTLLEGGVVPYNDGTNTYWLHLDPNGSVGDGKYIVEFCNDAEATDVTRTEEMTLPQVDAMLHPVNAQGETAEEAAAREAKEREEAEKAAKEDEERRRKEEEERQRAEEEARQKEEEERRKAEEEAKRLAEIEQKAYERTLEGYKDAKKETIESLKSNVVAVTDNPDKFGADLVAERKGQLRAVNELLEKFKDEDVPDWINDTAKAARERGYRMVNGERVDRHDFIPDETERTGTTTEVKFSTKPEDAKKATFYLVEADELVPSHVGGTRNPEYFINEAQPKDRVDNASLVAMRQIANNINPEEITGGVTAYTGSPVINERGEVIQGNNRSEALRNMTDESKRKYRDYLMANADRFGLDRNEIEKMQNPILVRILEDVSDDEAIRLGQMNAQDTESGGKQAINPQTFLTKLGDKFGGFIRILMKSEEDEDLSLAELITANGLDALKWAATQGALNNTQLQSALENGVLTPEAKKAITDTINLILFEGGTDTLPTKFKSLPQSSQRAILSAISREIGLTQEQSLKPFIQEAIEAYYEAKKGNTIPKDYEGALKKIKSVNQETDAFETPRKFSNFALEIAARLASDTQKTLTARLNLYYDDILGTGADLFNPDSTPKNRVESFKDAFEPTLTIEENGDRQPTSGTDSAGNNQEGEGGQSAGEGDTGPVEPSQPGGGSASNGGPAQGLGGAEPTEGGVKPSGSGSSNGGSKKNGGAGVNASRAEAQAYADSKYGKGSDKAKKYMKMWDKTHKNNGGETNMSLSSLLGFNGELNDETSNGNGLTPEEERELVLDGMDFGMDFITDDGAVKYADFFAQMVNNFGDGIRPYVAQIYLGLSAKVDDDTADQMDDRATVRKFDINTPVNDNDNGEEPIQGEGQQEPHNDGDEAEPSDNGGEPSGRNGTGPQGESGTGVGTDEGAGNTAPESERNPEPTDTEGTGEDGRGSDEGSGRTDTEGTGQPGTHTDGVDEGADGNPDLSPRADGNDAGMAPERSEREPEKVDTSKALKEGKEKVPYVPKSGGKGLNSVIPINVADVTQECLSRFDDIDEYVRKELGYKTKEEMWGCLSAEQVDGVAMSIEAMRKGYSMIIGDQTGLGKGRQAASLLRYAMQQGKKPIFFTQKASLFTDLYRDMMDTGSGKKKPLIINAEEGDILDRDGKLVYAYNEKDVNQFLKTGKVPKGYDYVVVTYSQIQGTNANSEARKEAIGKLAKDNVVIFDESHTAAGESNTGAYIKDVVRVAEGVTFLSATFAKNPSCMPLYALRSVIADANIEQKDLIKAIKRGGVPLMEIMSQALTASGAMIRRERNMDGVVTNWNQMNAKPHEQRQKYDEVITLFREITDFQQTYIAPMIDAIRKGYGGSANVFYLNNRARLYNLVNQMTTAIKIEGVIEEALDALANGEKPYITLAETNESMMNDFFPIGEEINKADIAVTLERSLAKCFEYLVKPQGQEEGIRMKIDPETELDPFVKNEYELLKAKLQALVTELPISPIDTLIEALEEKGYKVGEVTGRGGHVVTKDGKKTYEKREKPDKNTTIGQFNSNEIDVLIMNQSGSTGLSIHADPRFKTIDGKTKPRHHITLQPQKNIDDESQMRGRGDRTGQMTHCSYTYVVSHIPAEQRIMMMLKKKLASLDAQTTSSAKSKNYDVDTIDFGNKYGSEVIVDILKENFDLYQQLDDPFGWIYKASLPNETRTVDQIAAEYRSNPDDYDKVMKRIGMLLTEEQEAFYEQVFERYKSRIDLLNATGMNDLEITEMPLDAETKQIAEVIRGENPGGNNVFADSAYVEEVECNTLAKPMSESELKATIASTLKGKTPDEYREELLERVDAYEESEKERIEQQYKEGYEARVKSATERLQKQRDEAEAKGMKWADSLWEQKVKEIEDRAKDTCEKVKTRSLTNLNMKVVTLRKGLSNTEVKHYYNVLVRVTANEQINISGVVVGYKLADNMSTNTSYIQLATIDGRRMYNIPFGDSAALSVMSNQERHRTPWELTGRDITDRWDSMLGSKLDKRETRHIITGNLLTAINAGHNGQIISYTTKDGEVKRGILLPKGYNLSKLGQKKPFVDAYRKVIDDWEKVTSADGQFTITPSPRNSYYTFRFSFRKSNKNKAIAQDPELIKILSNVTFSEDRKEDIERQYDQTKTTYSYDFDSDETLKKLMQYLTDKYGALYNEDLTFNSEDQDNAIKDIKREKRYELSEIDHFFYDWNTNDDVKALADKIFPIARNLGMEITFGSTSSKDVGGSYSSKNRIKLKYNFFAYNKDPQYRAEVLLHEVIHSVTAYAIWGVEKGQITEASNPELYKAVQELKATWELIKDDPTLAFEYGATSVHEMLAEMANVKFREKLKKVNLWKKLVNAVKDVLRKMFSYAVHENETAFERVERNLQTLLDNFDDAKYKEVIKANPNWNAEYRSDQLNEKATDNNVRMRRKKGEVDTSSEAYDEFYTMSGELSKGLRAAVMEAKRTLMPKSASETENLKASDGAFKANDTDTQAFPEYSNANADQIFEIGRNGAKIQDDDIEIGGRAISDIALDEQIDGMLNIDSKQAVGADVYVAMWPKLKRALETFIRDAQNLADRLDDGEMKDLVRSKIDEANYALDYYKRLANGEDVVKQGWRRPAYRRRSNGQFVSSERDAKVKDAIEGTAKSINGKVRIISDTRSVRNPNVKRMLDEGRGIAYYDVDADEVVIYLPNVTDEDDAKRTVLHEVLGHKGLRQVYGKEKFDKKMHQLFASLPKDDKLRVWRIAEQLRAEDSNRNGQRAYLAEAMDEYLAECAEEYEPTDIPWWGRVIAMVKDMLRDLGISVRMTSDDITYMLWRSANALKQGKTPWEKPLRDVKMQRKYGTGLFDTNRYDPDDDPTPGGGGGRGRTSMRDRGTGSNAPAPVFVSNALRAVENIKQEKATPEQWLKMIEKGGGLKAGEDKWIGLSEWLKNNDKKTLTKAEVAEYILQNQIEIKEARYVNFEEATDELTRRYREILKRLQKQKGDISENYAEAYEELRNRFANSDLFYRAFKHVGGGVLGIWDESAARQFLGASDIHSTRLGYTTSGLKNKREIALVVPTIESYNWKDEIHFGNAGEGRAIAWIRFGETTTSDEDAERREKAALDALEKWDDDMMDKYETDFLDEDELSKEELAEHARLEAEYYAAHDEAKKGKRVLVIDEIQSKRHQDGREFGYKGDYKKSPQGQYQEAMYKLDSFKHALAFKYGEWWLEDDLTEAEREHYKKLYNDALEKSFEPSDEKTYSVPDAPFEKNWYELAMKRMLRLAANNGYDKVAWTKGEQQVKRYDIEKVVEKIESRDGITEGTKVVVITHKNDWHINDFGVEKSTGKILGGEWAGRTLSEVVGKEAAQELLADGDVLLESGNFKYGGEGMRAFYDQILPSFMNKYGKKWGVKVGEVELPNVEEAGRTMWSIDVTPEMKESVMQGQPMFRRRDNVRFRRRDDKADRSIAGRYYNKNARTVRLKPEGLSILRPRESLRNMWDAIEQIFSNSFLNYIDEAWHDYRRSLNILQKAAEKESGKPIADSQNVYMQHTALSSKNHEESERLMRRRVEPLFNFVADLFKRKNTDKDELEKYLIAVHGPERNEVFAKRDADRAVADMADTDPDKPAAWAAAYAKYRAQDYSGLTETFREETDPKKGADIATLEARAAQYATEYEARIGDEDINTLWDMVDGLAEETLKKAYTTGMTSKETYEKTKTQFTHYVPLRGWDEEAAGDVYEYADETERKEAVQQTIKNAFGRKSRAGDILETMAAMAHSAILVGNKNVVKQALLRLAEGHRTPLMTVTRMWFVKDPSVAGAWMAAILPDDASDPMFAGKPYAGKSWDAMDTDEKADFTSTWEDEMKKLKAAGDAKETSIGLRLSRPITDAQMHQHQVRVMRNGKQYVVNINGAPNAAQAINEQLNMESSPNFFDRMMSAANRFLARAYTSWNPEFLFRNVQRDMLSAANVSTIKYGKGYVQQLRKNIKELTIGLSFLSDRYRDKARASVGIGGLYKLYNSDRIDESVEMERYFKEFMENGGETGYSHLWNVKDFERQLKDASAKARRGKTGKAVGKFADAFIMVGSGVQWLNRCFENVTRFAVYMTSRQQGKSILQSINDAKEASTNFNKKGSGALGNRWFRDMFTFMNASIQGTMRYYALLRDTDEHKFNLNGMGAKAFASLVATFTLGVINTVTQAMLAAMLVGDDDDEPMEDYDNPYWRISAFRRRNTLVVGSGMRGGALGTLAGYVAGGKTGAILGAAAGYGAGVGIDKLLGEEDKQDVALYYNLGVEEAAIYGVGAIVGEKMVGHGRMEDMPGEILSQLFRMVPVLDGLDPSKMKHENLEQIVNDLAAHIIGTFPKIFIDAFMTNKDYMGRDIANRTDFNKGKPEYERVRRDTPAFEVKHSKWLYDHWGYDLNPNIADYIVRNTLGGAYQFPVKVYDFGYRLLVQGQPNTAEQTPILSTILQSTDQDWQLNRELHNQFYSYKYEIDKVDMAINAMKRRRGSGESEESLKPLKERIEKDDDYKLWRLWQNDKFKKAYNSAKRKGDTEKADKIIKLFLKAIEKMEEQEENEQE